MWNKTFIQYLGVACILSMTSCDKAQDLLAEITGGGAPKERREGITEVYSATAADVALWKAEPNVLVVLDFYSDSCPPCVQMKPVLAKLAKTYGDKAAILKLNVGKPGEVATMAKEEYKVSKIPSLKFFLNGKEVKSTTGGKSESELDAIFSKYTGKIDGEYVMKEGPMPGQQSARSVEEMMVRPKKGDLPPGFTRVRVPKKAKSVTHTQARGFLNAGAPAAAPVTK